MARSKKNELDTDSIIENDVVENDTGDDAKIFTPVSVSTQELKDEDEIEVVSIVPNVFYKDKQTEDIYEWRETGHSEFLPYSVVKTMWKNNKGYFKDLYLKPMDERVTHKFGLSKVYNDFDFITDPTNYTRNNMNQLFTLVAKMSNGMKFVLVNKIKEFVMDGSISDVAVLKWLGKKMDVDFISFT